MTKQNPNHGMGWNPPEVPDELRTQLLVFYDKRRDGSYNAAWQLGPKTLDVLTEFTGGYATKVRMDTVHAVIGTLEFEGLPLTDKQIDSLRGYLNQLAVQIEPLLDEEIDLKEEPK